MTARRLLIIRLFQQSTQTLRKDWICAPRPCGLLKQPDKSEEAESPSGETGVLARLPLTSMGWVFHKQLFVEGRGSTGCGKTRALTML